MAPQIIEFSHKVIILPTKSPFILTITNQSQTHALLFKIKTTKLNTYEVKPPLGFIQPGEKKNIQFKLVKPLSEQQLRQARNKDKFQFQFLAIIPTGIPKGKPQFKSVWDEFKGTPEKSNIVNYTFPIMMQSQTSLFKTVGDQPLSPVKTKNSLFKQDYKSTSVKKSFVPQSDLKKDEELSKQFQNLKQKEEQLLQQREKIFKSQPKMTQSGSKSGVQNALIVIAFLLSILIGNFLRLRVFLEEQL